MHCWFKCIGNLKLWVGQEVGISKEWSYYWEGLLHLDVSTFQGQNLINFNV